MFDGCDLVKMLHKKGQVLKKVWGVICYLGRGMAASPFFFCSESGVLRVHCQIWWSVPMQGSIDKLFWSFASVRHRLVLFCCKVLSYKQLHLQCSNINYQWLLMGSSIYSPVYSMQNCIFSTPLPCLHTQCVRTMWMNPKANWLVSTVLTFLVVSA